MTSDLKPKTDAEIAVRWSEILGRQSEIAGLLDTAVDTATRKQLLHEQVELRAELGEVWAEIERQRNLK